MKVNHIEAEEVANLISLKLAQLMRFEDLRKFADRLLCFTFLTVVEASAEFRMIDCGSRLLVQCFVFLLIHLFFS